MSRRVQIGRLCTGVPGLDILLGGGLGEFSFNVISGAPGTGKTTLAHQIMFAQASPATKAVFFTVLGEPPLKMLRYQQQYAFFDIDKVESCIRYVNLAEDLRTGDFSGVLARIMKEVEQFSPGLVFVDSFRSVVQMAKNGNEGLADLQQFVQELATMMTSWQATTFLIGEYNNGEIEANPVMTVADGMLLLTHDVVASSAVRKIRIVKMRGQAHMEGVHTFRITDGGLQVYPRLLPQIAARASHDAGPVVRISTGTPGLDELFFGGLPQGHALMVVGPSGAGKTILGNAFLVQGAREGQRGVLACFEKGRRRVRTPELASLIGEGLVSVVGNRALDLSVDQILDELVLEVERTGATRVVIDSLTEIGLYLAPEFRHDFRESVFRILSVLADAGVTVLVTMGLEDRFTDLRFSHAETAYLADAIVALRYVEVAGQLAKVISVVKVRDCAHSTDLRRYDITERGVQIAPHPMDYEGLLSGHPSHGTRVP